MPPTRKTSLEKKLANATVTPDEIYKYLTIDKGLSQEQGKDVICPAFGTEEPLYLPLQQYRKNTSYPIAGF